MAENGRSRAESWHPTGRIRIGAELVIKAPGADFFAKKQNLGRGIWVCYLDENAFKQAQSFGHGSPAVFGQDADMRAAAVHKNFARLANRAGPNAFALDFGVQSKSRS